MVDCGPRFAILYWTVYYQCKVPVSGKSEPIILKKLDLFSWKFHEIHTQRSLVMRAQKLLYVFARRYQMISACMTVSVRELRTAVREWACCYPIHIDTISMQLSILYIKGFTGRNFYKMMYFYPWRLFYISKQCRPWWNAALCNIRRHFIWVFTVCQSTCL